MLVHFEVENTKAELIVDCCTIYSIKDINCPFMGPHFMIKAMNHGGSHIVVDKT